MSEMSDNYPEDYPPEACEDIAFRDERIDELKEQVLKLQDKLELEELTADTASHDICDYRNKYHAMKRQVRYLQDAFNNGIKYDEKHNQYVVVWTEFEIAEAQKEADKIMESFNRNVRDD